jgi:LCP family protein required for cell wall assembly
MLRSIEPLRHLVYWVFLLSIAAAVGGSAAYAGGPWVSAFSTLSSMTQQKVPVAVHATFTPVATPKVTGTLTRPTPTATVPPIRSASGRINYLLLGSDNDAKNRVDAVPNTQVIIFVSYDTKNNQIYMVSIPRDLYVPITGFITDKISTAASWGGSFGTVEQTVEDLFRVKIDNYAWVGLQGFVNIINTLGGIDVDVAHPMVESNFPDDLDPTGSPYAIRRFYIPAGPQHLDGITALEYVRARHSDLIGDFGRSERQQQVLLQVKHKLTNADISEFPMLIDDMKHEVKTDLSATDILSLALSVLHIGSGSIHHFYLDVNGGYVVDNQHTPSGDALIPQWPKINALFACIMSEKAQLGCSNP